MKTLKAPRLFLALTLVLISTLAASAKIAPELTPRTLETKHFRVHFPVGSESFAELLAPRLEEAFLFLSKELDWVPASTIDVVVRADIDQANGFAEAFPTNRLVIQAVPPAPWGFDAESDDWLRTLVFHELTHIIANDETSGIFRALRSLIGTAAKPNPYQPAWLIEGLAVYEETHFTRVGRGRSAWSDMVLRAAANAGLLVSKEDPAQNGTLSSLEIPIDRLNDGVDRWPAGHVPYLLGYALTEVFANRSGSEAPAKVSKSNSHHLPFFIENVAQDVLGASYGGIWSDTVSRLKRAAKVDRDQIRAAGENSVQPMTAIGRKTRGPATVGDSVYFLSDSYRRGTEISRIPLSGGGAPESVHRFRPFDEHASTESVGTRLRRDPDGRTLLYSRIELHLEHSLFSDVFLYDLDREAENRITFGARALDPDPSPDFAWNSKKKKIDRGFVAYVKQLIDGRQALAFTSGEKEVSDDPEAPTKVKETILREGEKLERISSPLWGTGDLSGWLFYFSKPVDRGTSLEAIQFQSRKRVTVFSSAAPGELSISPDWEKSGDFVFSSNSGGIFNLRRITRADLRAAIELGRAPKVETITNAENGVLAGVDGVGLVYSERGLDLARVEMKARATPPKIEPLRGKLLNHPEDSIAIGAGERKSVEEETRRTSTEGPYSVFPALWPHYWAPDFRIVPDGVLVGARTGSRDAWERNEYQLIVRDDTRAKFPLWDASYRYDGLFPTFEFSARQENNYFATDRESNRLQTNEVNALIPAGRDSSFGLGALAQTSHLDGDQESTGGFALSWNYQHMRTGPDSIDREGESGVEGSMSLTGFFVGQERFSEFRTKLETRIPSFFDRHFFRLNGEYGRSNNDRLSAHYFLGGGEETITPASSSTFLLRGYEPGTIFGRKILTANFEYVFPVLDLCRGWGTFPAFFDSTRAVLFLDTGSAEVVGSTVVNLNRFVSGGGVHFLSDFNFLYRVPVTFAIGFDRGFNASAGGENRFVLGLYSRIP